MAIHTLHLDIQFDDQGFSYNTEDLAKNLVAHLYDTFNEDQSLGRMKASWIEGATPRNLTFEPWNDA